MSSEFKNFVYLPLLKPNFICMKKNQILLRNSFIFNNKIIFFIPLFALFFSFSCHVIKNGNYYIFSLPENPPAMFQWIDKGVLAAKITEVTVNDYLFFLETVSKDSSEEYLKELIPSNECALFPYLRLEKGLKSEAEDQKMIWLDVDAFKEKMYAKKNPVAFIDEFEKPITGISFDQAEEYAAWCTFYFNKEQDLIKNGNRIIIFRLPTPAEFTNISKRGMEDCDFESDKYCEINRKAWKECANPKGCALCNCAGKPVCETNKQVDEMFGKESLYTVNIFSPNFIGLMDVQGNAAEMTNEKGIAKGGSYLNTAKECLPDAIQKYEKPEKWLGFRLIAEVVDISTTKMYFDDEGKLREHK